MPPTIVTGYTAEKMLEILNNVVKAMAIDENGHLIITKYNDATADLGLVKGAKGDDGDTGPPGTAGVWYTDTSPQSQTLDTAGTYKGVGTIVIPTATYARKVVLWSQVSLLGFTTIVTTYRASIRDNTSGTPDTVATSIWWCSSDGQPGSINVVTNPIDIPANQGKTFVHHVRRDGGAAGAHGQTDGDGVFGMININISCCISGNLECIVVYHFNDTFYRTIRGPGTITIIINNQTSPFANK